MLSSTCNRCDKHVALGDTYGAGFPNREGMWGRDYITVLSEGDAKWMLQIGVTNNSPDLTICAGCVLELTRQALVQAGVLDKEATDGPTDPDPSEHPHMHEMSTASNLQATGPDYHPDPHTPGGKSADGSSHFHHDVRYDTYPDEDNCAHCDVWPLCSPR